MADYEGYLRIGKVSKPHGIRGDFFVFLESDFPQWVASRRQFLAEVDGKLVTWDVTSSRMQRDRLVLKVEQVPDRNAAERFRDTLLFVSEEEAREAIEDSDTFLNNDLIGLRMISQGNQLGEVVDVIEMPGQNLLEVKGEDGKTFLFPFAVALIEDIDLDEAVITVTVPDGLLDIND